MAKISTCMLLALVAITYAKAQDSIYTIHPSVGSTIDSQETKKYLLFPEITDTTFSYCDFSFINNTYFVNYHFKSDSIYRHQIDSEKINEYKTQITKLDNYFNSLQKKDSTQYVPTNENQTNITASSKEIINSQSIMKIKEETIASNRLKDDDERKKQSEMLGEPTMAVVDLGHCTIKKKKHKRK